MQRLKSGLAVRLRDREPKIDDPLVLASWARQIRRLPPFRMFDRAQFEQHMDLVRSIYNGSTRLIACHPLHKEQIFGFIVGRPEESVLHMLYVRNIWRRKGVANALLGGMFLNVGKDPIYYTHPAKAARYHENRWGLVFNPYLTVKHENNQLQGKARRDGLPLVAADQG